MKPLSKRSIAPPRNIFEYANPTSMNRPAYLTVPASSPVFGTMAGHDRPCIQIKPHLAKIINLVAEQYGPIANYRILAGNVIGTGGWRDLPVEKQHMAVTQSAGAFIASGMMYLEVKGSQAADLLDYLTPRNIKKVSVGCAPFTIFTTPEGGVDEEALVLRLSENRFLVSCGGGQMPSNLVQALGRFPDVQVNASDLVSFNIKGPKRKAAMLSLVADGSREKVEALKPFQATQCKSAAGDDVTVVRTVIGFEMWGSMDTITQVWKDILSSNDLIMPCGWDLLDTFRMECNAIDFLLHPLDMNYATSLFDTGLDWMIDWNKEADYVGKAALQKLKKFTPALTTTKVIGAVDDSVPPIGEAVRLASGTVCGHVTSAGYSYSANAPIAYVHLSNEIVDDFDTIELEGWMIAKHALQPKRTPAGI